MQNFSDKLSFFPFCRIRSLIFDALLSVSYRFSLIQAIHPNFHQNGWQSCRKFHRKCLRAPTSRLTSILFNPRCGVSAGRVWAETAWGRRPHISSTKRLIYRYFLIWHKFIIFDTKLLKGCKISRPLLLINILYVYIINTNSDSQLICKNNRFTPPLCTDVSVQIYTDFILL